MRLDQLEALTGKSQVGGPNVNGGSLPIEAPVEWNTETMKLKITATRSGQIFGYCAIYTAVAFVSVSANAQNFIFDTLLLREAFLAADTNGDYRIDESELAADTVAAFAAVDDNGDDQVSAEELDGAGVAGFGKLDVDKNKSLTIIEVMNAKIVEFQNADANGDGELTIDEITQYERRR